MPLERNDSQGLVVGVETPEKRSGFVSHDSGTSIPFEWPLVGAFVGVRWTDITAGRVKLCAAPHARVSQRGHRHRHERFADSARLVLHFVR